ncbi:MAG: hypothetical protein ACRDKL_09265 [Solirubrobacteraceae bacterium]
MEARRVLLDALVGLKDHTKSLTLVGAQAVYLHTGTGNLAVAPYTFDGDLALDPRSLGDDPRIDAAMEAAGFRHSIVGGHPEPGIWVAAAEIGGQQYLVPVDLIVPEGFAPPGGSRGARLGPHGNRAARRAVGLEAALVDKDPMAITALDPVDSRTVTIDVAGVAALLVAKAHKIHDRVASGKPGRVGDKDAADVVRMMQSTPIPAVTEHFGELLGHEIAGPPTSAAVSYLGELFGRRGGAGVQMAVRALTLALSEQQVETVSVAYTEALLQSVVDRPGRRGL